MAAWVCGAAESCRRPRTWLSVLIICYISSKCQTAGGGRTGTKCPSPQEPTGYRERRGSGNQSGLGNATMAAGFGAGHGGERGEFHTCVSGVALAGRV